MRLVLLLVVAVAACSEAPPVSTCIPGVEVCETPPTEDEVVAGVNLTALFASASATEVDAAAERRPAGASPGTVEVVALADAPDGARRVRLTLRDEAGALVHAVARVPGPAGAATLLPVVVVLTDGEDGASEADALTGSVYATLAAQTVQVVVGYRGEPLRLGDATLASDAEADPYRADVSDLLALLPALSQIPRADAGRVALVGVGRGGTVGLLAALADPSVDAIVTMGAPTDLLGASFRDDVRTRLRGGTPPSPYPAFEALVAPVLALRDGAIEAGEARLRLLALSPGHAGADLPAVLALHAVGDEVVGDEQLARLRTAMALAGGGRRTAVAVQNATHEGLPADVRVQGDIAAFLLDVL